MNWKTNIERWRKLSPEQKRAIRLRRIPQKVANSMAFEGEPVDLAMLERELARLIEKPSTEDDK